MQGACNPKCSFWGRFAANYSIRPSCNLSRPAISSPAWQMPLEPPDMAMQGACNPKCSFWGRFAANYSIRPSCNLSRPAISSPACLALAHRHGKTSPKSYTFCFMASAQSPSARSPGQHGRRKPNKCRLHNKRPAPLGTDLLICGDPHASSARSPDGHAISAIFVYTSQEAARSAT